MKLRISDWYTDGYPTKDEIERVCKIGQGDDTCVWLVCGAEGFECSCCHKPVHLLKQWEAGQTIAKRNGCNTMNSINTVDLGAGVHEVELK